MEKEYLTRMISFAQKAGDFALKKQFSLQEKELKADQSLITETDLAISEMIQKDFADIFEQEEHLLVDEESYKKFNAYPHTAFKHKYLWVIDPIDGTAPYGAGLPFFGVSLGLVKNGQPFMGVIYLPLFDELYVADGQKSYLIKSGKTKRLYVNEKSLMPTDIFIMNPKYFIWKDVCYTGYQNTSVLGLSWVAAGKLIGQCNYDNFWDIAAGWAICQQAGLEIYDFLSGQKFKEFNNMFDQDWRLKAPQITTKSNLHQKLRDSIEFKNA